MWGLVMFVNDQVKGTLNIFVVPMYMDCSGSPMRIPAGGSGGLDMKARLAISLLIMCCNLISVMVSLFFCDCAYKYHLSLLLIKVRGRLLVCYREREVEVE